MPTVGRESCSTCARPPEGGAQQATGTTPPLVLLLTCGLEPGLLHPRGPQPSWPLAWEGCSAGTQAGLGAWGTLSKKSTCFSCQRPRGSSEAGRALAAQAEYCPGGDSLAGRQMGPAAAPTRSYPFPSPTAPSSGHAWLSPSLLLFLTGLFTSACLLALASGK